MIAMPLISIIVPVYNTRVYLRECLDSILEQSGVEVELIIIDDGSDDGCEDICKVYSSRYDTKVILINTPHVGPAACRNAGIENTHGEFIVFCDSDDVLLKDALLTLYDMLKRHPEAGIAVGQMVTYAMGANVRGEETIVDSKTAMRKTLYQEWSNHSSPCAKMYRRSIFEKEREWFIPGRKYEDLEAFPRLYRAAEKIAVTTKNVYYYRQHSDSFLHRWEAARKDTLWATERIEEYIGSILPELLPAAKSRRFSASFNMFILGQIYGDRDLCDTSWMIIRRYRSLMLTDRNVRMKNKCGALMSFLGARMAGYILRLIARK